MNEALRLVPAPRPEYQECPRWCLGHYEEDGVRRCTGPAETVMGSRPILLSVEHLDDGQGSARTVYFLAVGGLRVELAAGRMHELMKASERVFWKQDKSGNTIGDEPNAQLIKKVRTYLHQSGVSQAELARRAHISPSMLSLVLSGQRNGSGSIERALDKVVDAPADPQNRGGRA